MRGSLSTLAFVIYVGLDLSNPLMPGAFNFNPEQCVEATHLDARRAESTPVAASAGPEQLLAQATTARQIVRRAVLADRRPERRQPCAVAHGAPPPPSPPTEDH